MAKPRNITIQTLAAFANQVEKYLDASRRATPNVKTVVNWYRGHSCASYKLEPHLYRHKTIKDAVNLLALESQMMADFKRQSMLSSYHQAADDPKDRVQLLFYMQHHGVPTRLLDWSSNPFIALYFALSGAKRDEGGEYVESAAVWILDPYRWNKHALQELKWEDCGPAFTEDTRIKSYLPTETDPLRRYPWPIAISGAANTPRMMAQRGNFTIFSDDLRPMEEIYRAEGFPADSLIRIEIPAEKIDSVLQVLIAVGYTDSVAYPDLQGLAMEIRRMHGFRA